MASDSISKNPEAIRAAMEAQRGEIDPPAAFHTRKIFREEYEKIVDPTLETRTMEQVWGALTDGLSRDGTVLGTVTEGEYRQFCKSVAYHTQATNLATAADRMGERANSYKSIFFAEVQEARGLQTKNMTLHLDTGTLREHNEPANPFAQLLGGQLPPGLAAIDLGKIFGGLAKKR